MGGDVDTIKQRLDIAEIVGGHVKLEKSGQSLKGRCPFHNEKTPSFFVSPARQSYYCFGCGAKGDIFTFVQEIEGLSFREALKELAERAGVELSQTAPRVARSEKERLRDALEAAASFYADMLAATPAAKEYLLGRGLSEESLKVWRVGYAPAEWRALYDRLLPVFGKETLIKAGLAKPVAGEGKPPYDVFRDRLVFPLFDQNGEIVGFSGRALGKDVEPKYLNTPETVLFAKHELLYGLDRAKAHIRKKNYAVLVEGQMDLVLSHQAGVENAVASSGTAFTAAHLERLKRLSPRILLAFDGDAAGEKAAEKAAHLALSLGLEVKVAKLPAGSDPADIVKKDPADWKEILRRSESAIEFFLGKLLESESDRRKLGKLIETKLLPMLALLTSSIERSHFVSVVSKRTGIKEEMIWEDLRRTKQPLETRRVEAESAPARPRLSRAEELAEVTALLKESPEDKDLVKQKEELEIRVRIDELDREIEELGAGEEVSEKKFELTRARDEERRKLL